MSHKENLKALENYFSLMCMNGGSHIFRTAGECGLFNYLRTPMKLEDLVEKSQLHAKPLKLILDVLVSLEVVNLRDELYSLSAVMQFLNGNYQNLSDEYWLHLKKYLTTGEPFIQVDAISQSEEYYFKQVKSLEWMMTPSALYAAQALGIGNARKSFKVLDLGAGSAVWSLTFAQHDPTLQVTAVDWQKVLQIAQLSASQKGVAKQFTSLAGNYHEVSLPNEEFDIVIVANVTHLETKEGNMALFSKAYNALKSNGELLVIDVFEDQEKGKNAAAIYHLGLALRTVTASLFSKEELVEILSDCQFKTSYIPLEITPYTMGMIIAKKS